MKKSQLIRTIDQVFLACGLLNFANKKVAIAWKKKVKKRHSGWDITMKFPVGKCMEDIERNYDRIVTALNGADIRFGKQGGWLKMEIYTEPLPSFIPFNSDLLLATRNTWKVPIIHTQDRIIFHDFTQWPHLKVGGVTRKGKTVALKGITTTLLANHNHNQIKLILLDGKKFASFAKYEQFPHVVQKGWDVKSAYLALEWTAGKLDERMDILRKHGVEDTLEYEENYGESLPRYFVIVDEAFMFRAKDAKDDEDMV